jgi:hypothetical protein
MVSETIYTHIHTHTHTYIYIYILVKKESAPRNTKFGLLGVYIFQSSGEESTGTDIHVSFKYEHGTSPG